MGMSITNRRQGTPDSANDTMLNVRISGDLKRRLVAAAVANGESVSDLVRLLLVLHIDTKEAQA